ncbi:MAG: ABC transporter permease, partial [Verrucomicrobia bacterium]|nr:ABC transporter permease [Verrucomicrobiota bacterium]
LDELLMRFVDFTHAIPFILVAIVVVVVFGSSLALILILLIVFTWGGFARQARAATLSLKTQDYVAMAKIAGASPIRIIVRHILPGIFSTMMVLASLAVGGLILAEATLSFLGVGIPKPAPAWGLMVADGRQFLRDAWWVAMMPGIAIFATVFSVNFLGDWMRDRFDPRLRQL